MNVKEKAGDFLIDVAKLVIGGVVLASIITENVDALVLYLGGSAVAFGLTLLGFYLYKSKEKEN